MNNGRLVDIGTNTVNIVTDIDHKTVNMVLEAQNLILEDWHRDKDPDYKLDVILNTDGGCVDAATAVINVLNLIRPVLSAHNPGNAIHTHALSSCSSAGVDIFLEGDARVMYPGSYLMMHDFSVSIDGMNNKNVVEYLKVQQTRRTAHLKKLRSLTGMTNKEIESYFFGSHDVYFSSKQALKLGLATHIK